MPLKPEEYIANLRSSGKSIYDVIDSMDEDHYIPIDVLEKILHSALVNTPMSNLAPRSRSKFAKIKVCEALGYPIPKSFKKTQPRFTGQNFDTYNQQALNLQIWNELIDPERRYVLIRINDDEVICRVKVVLGVDLIPLDKTGKVTTKFQANLDSRSQANPEQVTKDTSGLSPLVIDNPIIPTERNPSQNPMEGELFSIKALGEKLKPLIGQSFEDSGRVQDRNRGEGLHRLVCQTLGYHIYGDSGQFPDVRHQLLEVKLQTSPTIDLGHVLPTSKVPIGMGSLKGFTPRHCDTRYAVFYGEIHENHVHLTDLHLVTGETFFSRFRQFGGLKINGKRQMLLPKSLFDE
ncbi:MAG: hypothetical protein ABI644_03205 [Arenimonas sp.]